MKDGLYLCKVKGLKHCDYAILRHSDNEWWQYCREYVAKIEGWIGIKDDLEIIEIVQEITHN